MGCSQIHRIAYRAGITTGIASPASGGFLRGISVAFSLGAAHKLEQGAVVADVAALHVTIAHGDVPSVSTEIAALRRVLLNPPEGDAGKWYAKVAKVRWVLG